MREANFDGLVGPTHHYAGHSFGNVASTRNAKLVSNPKRAALQGLAKAARVRDLGLLQGFLPPLRRPRLDTLRSLGFTGTDSAVIERAFRAVPQLLSACYSASSMWVANAATFTPSTDSSDGRAHFTPANLSSKFHRSLETRQTAANLRQIFPASHFTHHDPIIPQFGDEGAANHSRIAPSHGEKGIELFTYGGSALQDGTGLKPKKFPARQSIEAAHAISTTHAVERVLLVQQNPDAVDAGAFHNDVVAVANENVLFMHERAYQDQAAFIAESQRQWLEFFPGEELIVIQVKETDVSLDESVRTYLFNSQLVTTSPGKMLLLAPEECRETEAVRQFIEKIIGDPANPISGVHFFDVRESMQNGGGPACLRLRVALTKDEERAVHPSLWLTLERELQLTAWISKHYRERIVFDDLRDPKLFQESQVAMDDLEKILGMTLA
jgi:succinylarginine dihydrolase